jgi:hypothetical protein
MRQVQKMQEEVERVQAEASEEVVTTSVGGGVVKVTINGALEIQSLTIDPDVVDPDEIEMLQDLVTAAVNEAIQKAQEMMSDHMASVTGGLGLPGLP